MNKNQWKDDGACRGEDTNLFFDIYEENEDRRPEVDAMCAACPLARQCFAVAVSQKEWGVWGGIYVENGKISREYNKHKTKADWANTWSYLTTDTKEQ